MNIKILALSFLLFSPLITLHAENLQTVAIAQPQWKIQPVLSYTNEDLENKNRVVEVKITGNTEGKILRTHVVKSSGVPALDKKVQDAVIAAEFRPYSQAFTVTQPFDMTLSPLQNNKIWLVKPYISYQNMDLQGQNRQLILELMRNNTGLIQTIQILQSTGLKHLDEKIIGQVKDARLDPKTTPEKLRLPLNLTTQFSEQKSRKTEVKDHMPVLEAEKIWQFFPFITYTNQDLNEQTRQLNIALSFNASGGVIKTEILQSSGLDTLDQKIQNQLKYAILYSHHAPITLNIPLVLTLKKTTKK